VLKDNEIVNWVFKNMVTW